MPISQSRIVGVVCWIVAASHLVHAQDVKPPVTDPATRLAWHAEHLAMRDRAPTKDLKWKHIGPLRMSGRVTDIAVPPGQPFTFYVATASGGLWKTVNEGTTWEPLFDDAPSASTGAVAVDPSNPKTVWVGLGESNIFRSSMSGTGIYKSTDEGKTWQHMGLPDSHHIARIIVHPTDSNTVYVAVGGHEYTSNEERGVFKTTDGGATWNKILYIDEWTGAAEMSMDMQHPDTLFVAMWHRVRRPWSDPLPGPTCGIHKTTDGGTSWMHLTEGLPPAGKIGRMGVAVAPSDGNYVYVIADNHEIARTAEDDERDSYGRRRQDVILGAEVYQSSDGGATFAKTSGDDKAIKGLFSTYGWVFGQMRVHPLDPQTIYCLGVPLLASHDGGKTFTSLDYRELHADHHALWINPQFPQHMINGNDGGINISYDGGKTWKNLENLPCIQFYNVAVDMAKPFNVYGSIQDNGSWMGPSNHVPGRSPESRWQPIRGGEASYIAVDPDDQNVIYSEGFYGSIMRTTVTPRETKPIVPKPGPEEPPYRGQWLAPFILSPHNSRIVYHGMNFVFRSVNRGDHWERISPDLTHNDPQRQGNISFATITTLSESPVRFGVLYAGTDDGRVHGTRDGGQHWTELNQGIPAHKWVSRVVASKFQERTVYLTQNGKTDNDFAAYVWRSDDFGQTWEDISQGIPGGPVNVIAEDPRAANVLYVGTDLGVYVSIDRGQTWNVLGSGLPVTFVHDFVVHPRDYIAVIATHGRGMFTLDLSKFVEPPAAPAEEKPAEGRQRSGDDDDDDE